MNQIVKSGNGTAIAQTEVTEELLKDYLNAMGLSKNLSSSEQTQFLNISKAYGLNPFKREIYATKYGSADMSIIVGYEVYLKRAERTGMLTGWSCITEGSVKEGDLRAVCTIHRKDRDAPFIWEVYYEECVQTTKDGTPNRFWRLKPRHMTKKVCISQSFRLAFPDELGGMPYTSDEVSTEPQTIEYTAEVVQEKPTPESKTPEGIPPTLIDHYQQMLSSEFFSKEEQEKYKPQPKWTEGNYVAAYNHLKGLYNAREGKAQKGGSK